MWYLITTCVTSLIKSAVVVWVRDVVKVDFTNQCISYMYTDNSLTDGGLKPLRDATVYCDGQNM